MKTPDEIKRALACYGGEMHCPDDCDVCALNTDYTDWHDVMNDARAYIQRLEGQVVAAKEILERVTRERDAAVADMKIGADGFMCDICANFKPNSGNYGKCPYSHKCSFEWRGVQEVEHEQN